MGFDDTGLCIPETLTTLLIQQWQLVRGKRDVQMFPIGTSELPLPYKVGRFKTDRGVFHYRRDRISEQRIRQLSDAGRENEFLMLGPFCKSEIAKRVTAGENLVCVTERTPDGVEVRSAAGTDTTIDAQRDYFERTKEQSNTVTISEMLPVLNARMRGVH